MHALYKVATIRAIEQAEMATLPAGTLMQRAGAATAQAALRMLAHKPAAATILVLAGPGNNGGDALDAAARLADAGARVSVLLCAEPDRLPQDAQQALQRARLAPMNFITTLPPAHWSLIIDGLFGIGLMRPIEGAMRTLITRVNEHGGPLLAIDVPSGLDADTGVIVGGDGINSIAIRATRTITFIADKPGLHTGFGQEQAGTVDVADLDIGPDRFPPTTMQLSAPTLFTNAIRRRSQASHKGTYGEVVVLGGGDGMTGAVLLAARAALLAGAGKTFAAFVGTVPSHDALHPELMCRSAATVDYGTSVIVAGPGLGQSDPARGHLLQALNTDRPLVLDADALNLIAAEPDLKARVARHPAPVILTPHPLEAARLMGSTAGTVQADRLHAAMTLARDCNAIVVLKGSGTIIARPDGQLAINPTGNPALASGGTGDVLAGLCGALLAQGWPAWEAATGAVWLHGHAADVLVKNGHGPVGLTASELLLQVRRELNRLVPATELSSNEAPG
ncbi:NAD(P)H-hydrate dehydratase [Actimicrobium antarcticum]|uniref:Bifunctional NAD(P)H-hydrate repair enzyme n=1 Tax=Actimicrobium antarcticum TaxID=1051899 RepID=A0ABP7SG28_9BURK